MKTESATTSFEIRDLLGCERKLWNVEPDARRVLTAVAVEAIADDLGDGDRWDAITRISYAVWNRARGLRCSTGRTVEDELRAANPGGVIAIRDDVVEPLVAAGDLEQTLLRKRAALDAQIAVLARRRGAAGARA